MSTHSQLAGLEVHEPYHFVQEVDPGAVGSGKYWLQVSTGIVKRRDNANAAWQPVSAGTTKFTGLSDVPASYVGQTLKALRVNAGETALEFFSFFTDPLTTKGDIHGRSATVSARVPVGSDGQVLTADSTNALGIAWAAAGGGGGGTFTATPPTTTTSTGTLGQYSLDANFAYFCVATNTWLRVQLSTMPLTIALTYVSDGDANGVFTFIGKGKSVGGTWSNPVPGSITGTTSAAMGSGTIDKLTDHATNDNYIPAAANSWYKFDLGANQRLVCNKWSFRQRNVGAVSGAPDVTLQGSNDDVTYTNVNVQASPNIPTGANVWGSFTVTSSTPYRWWRFKQSINDFFTCGELEIYGSLTYL